MSSDSYPMTPAGLRRLKAELKRTREVERPANVKEIEEALGHGDLRENSEYHAAKERQAALEGRMRYLEHRISRAQVIDPGQVQTDRVAFGATVTVLDVETDEETAYTIVGEDEVDVDRGRVSILSPIARALIGKCEGDDVLLRLPKGDRELEVVKLVYEAVEE